MTFSLPQARLREASISRHAGRRGLKALEIASLVTIRRPPGRSLELAILDAPGSDRNGQQ
jgi:hypothetical protein